MEIPKELERKARSRAILSMKFASDSPKLSYAELTLPYVFKN
ncbi:hypothetical protein LEP1GSC062_2607 [Leptospira alexanderi serovar Manhao 3 str. L 60]|uniref:Uncharacterized protein n=1 Tax=Leptospira alexanderi serovar Manhao 3 str. L 60 TaxID=1049759 RepID=V6HUT0_9LEPT|nr:hypothetical protein LEP1GSC062_2607 [Leptospira alexanderi serovar Manhao 3 str. L 60]